MLGGVLIIPLMAKQFNLIPFLPAYLIVLCLFGVGWVLGKILANLLVEKSKGKRIKKTFKKEEVTKVVKNSKNLKLLAWVEMIFLIGYCMFFLYSFLIEKISTQDSIELLILGFITSLMHHSVYPIAQQKAFRILKKQMKAGMYDE
ncbi:hypothetical protein RV18_GL003413 [Enterococcus termitis]|nr:hypothetical protein RV18_GL003413 [Enterococcus termitis]